MAVLVKNHGLELPVYDHTYTVAWETDDIKAASQVDQPSFLRRARLTGVPTDIPLEEALNEADAAIEDIRDQIGIKVVEYAWGLYKGGSIKNSIYGIPGYCLVAEVENVKPVVPMHPIDIHTINEQCEGYYLQALRAGRTERVMRDIHRADQFVKRSTDQLDFEFVLVDIEPMLLKPNVLRT